MEYLSIAIALALIPAAAWLDRQRGTSKETETLAKMPALIGLGLCNAFFVVDHGATLAVIVAQTAIVTAAVATAYNWPGFGEPIGHAITGSTNRKYEDWQFKALQTNPWVALIFYGAVFFPAGILLMSAIAAAIAYLASVHGFQASWTFAAAAKLALAHAIAWPGACAVVRYVLKMPVRTSQQSGAAWARQEEVRGAISMLVAAMIFLITKL
jgi:hypothetical protein